MTVEKMRGNVIKTDSSQHSKKNSATGGDKNTPKCHIVRVHTFRGDRGELGERIRKQLEAEQSENGEGPSGLECLIYSGHTGVSLDKSKKIWGFHPNYGNDPIWLVMQRLRRGKAYPGIVQEDSNVFKKAKDLKLNVLHFDVILPDCHFQEFKSKLTNERDKSRYKYGFPNGDGDCNCTTWLERLALPLLTGRMNEFTSLPGITRYPKRRFGKCI